MQYTHGQKLASAIWRLKGGDPEIGDLKSKSARMLDLSKEFSMQSGEWEPCETPAFTDYNYWSHGQTSSHPGANGGRMVWRWKQLKNEDWVYCLTETRQPIEGDPDGKWKTIEACSRKPLVLTPDAILFFTKVQNEVVLDLRED